MIVKLNLYKFNQFPNAECILNQHGIADADGNFTMDSEKADELIKEITGINPLDYPQKNKSKGLGDTVAKVFKATGIKAITDKVSSLTGRPCGCKARQEKLNQLFPYGSTTPEKPEIKPA